MYVGELAALGTAVCWALCSLAFTAAGRRIGALALNQIRILMAVVLLSCAHQVLLGGFWPEGVAARQYGWLAVSGVLGLSLGDLFLFRCFLLVGPRIGTLLMTTSPIITALIAWPVLGETIGARGVAGIAVTMAGVVIVLQGRHRAGTPIPESDGSRSVGVLMGLLGAAGQSGGLICAKLGMQVAASGAVTANATTADVPLNPLSATLIRMMAGGMAIWVLAAARGALPKTIVAARNGRAMAAAFVGAFLGPFCGVWLSLVSISHTATGIGATLMSTVPILMLPLARIAYGERITFGSILGTLLAVAGVAFLFVGRA